jgi:magnesium chelatase subunit D
MRSERSTPAFPFAAIVGHSQAKLALILLAIDRRLRGVLITSPGGSAKSLLARAAKSLFSDSKNKPLPFIEVPIGVSEDRLLGGLDIERSLRTGKKRFAAGLLGRADGGVLYADDVNLLDHRVTDQVAAALDCGRVQVERDGLSLATGADFVFIGSFNSEVASLNPVLRERVGLFVDTQGADSLDDRAEVASLVLQFEKDPVNFAEHFRAEMRSLKAKLRAAKKRLPGVTISEDDLKRLAAVSLSLAVAGHNADFLAARAARAHAALAKRNEVSEADMIVAIQLVLLPRATQMPDVETAPDHQPAQPQENRPQEPQPADGKEESEERMDESAAERQPDESAWKATPIEDLLIKAMDASLPGELFNHAAVNPKSKIQNPKSPSGKRLEREGHDRGRSYRVTAQKSAGRKVSIAATLRAAAPLQKARKGLPAYRNRTAKIAITPDDLRYKRYKRKSGILFIFAVDASGSMAVNRMAQAKGAMTRLLQEAYLHRDKVAMLSFRGNRAQVLLAPTRSVELAKRVVDAIPTGGATPMAAALMKALEVAKQAHAAELSWTVLLVFTDGRANIGAGNLQDENADLRGRAIKDELRQLGRLLNQADIRTLVIDTKAKFLAGGEARDLADLLGAEYVYLPRADDEAIYESLKRMRGDGYA